jgi:AraC-like DNA-binding protein
MEYVARVPAPPLDRFIDGIYCLTGVPRRRRMNVPPRLILSVDALRPVDWSELAQTAGYFDRAHFTREFKDFTGHTPTAYLALRRRFPAEQGFPPDNGPMPAD